MVGSRTLVLLLCVASRITACSVRYVSSTTGDDAHGGCLPASPLRTLAACIDAAGANGVCYLFPGRYREGSHQAGKRVEDASNLTIAKAPDALTTLLFNESFAQAAATIDGTVDLSTEWEQLSDVHGEYYRSTVPYNATVWQLFVNGAPLTAMASKMMPDSSATDSRATELSSSPLICSIDFNDT